ncbi:MAG: hypothetical protein DI556_13135 [Rhodovulum sulfidophilum]|uniref:Uncharacterized protein n=1 Tax=Rhodovulum sulfidophilum TaxID=35806 RepID=A0A2W5N5P8_RHOSU|nr:MAG: hypothetical protein DI556_13135 [Rhodovulum sulfidophilum]
MTRIGAALIWAALVGLPPVAAMAEARRTVVVLSFAPNAANPERLDQLSAAATALRAAADDPTARIWIEARFDDQRLEDAREAGIAPLRLRAIHQAGRDLALRRAAAARAALLGIAGPEIADRVRIELRAGEAPEARVRIEAAE